MRKTMLARILAAIAVICAVAPAQTVAGGLEVAPTTLEIPAGGGATVLYVANRGDVATMLQVEAFDWLQDGGETILLPTSDLMLSPPMTRLEPGQQQIVRVMLNPGAPLATERTFRLLVSELPAPSAEGATGIRVLIQFSVPVFALPVTQAEARLDWRLERRGVHQVVIARNGGTRRAKLSPLKLTAPDGRELAVSPTSFAYVLAGSTQEWKVDQAPGGTLVIEALDETSGTTLRATIAN